MEHYSFYNVSVKHLLGDTVILDIDISLGRALCRIRLSLYGLLRCDYSCNSWTAVMV
jgi:hypothetical protein